MFKGFNLKNQSQEKKPALTRTNHELSTAKFINHMSQVMTENKKVGYKSKILESSLLMDPERK